MIEVKVGCFHVERMCSVGAVQTASKEFPSKRVRSPALTPPLKHFCSETSLHSPRAAACDVLLARNVMLVRFAS